MSASTETRTAAPRSQQKVFICYRREETAAHAGRIYDAMVAHYGAGNVFMDVDMPPGVDFVKRITDVVSGCVALIVVMGPRWATHEDGDGRRRLDDPDDFVRLEVGTGLGNPDVTTIPVLVSGARMPEPESLPEELEPLTRRNALELSDGRWGYDIGRLNTALDDLLPGPAPPPRPRKRLILAGMLVAGLAAVAAGLLAELVPVPEDPRGLTSGDPDELGMWETRRQIAGTILQRAILLGIVGAAVATWLAVRVRQIDAERPLLRGLVVGALAGALSGAIWAVPVFLPDTKVAFEERAQIELAAIAVGGGLIGSLIGSLWRPSRAALGFASGAVGGVLFQLIAVLGTGWKNNTSLGEILLSYGLGAAAIVGVTLAVLIAVARE